MKNGEIIRLRWSPRLKWTIVLFLLVVFFIGTVIGFAVGRVSASNVPQESDKPNIESTSPQTTVDPAVSIPDNIVSVVHPVTEPTEPPVQYALQDLEDDKLDLLAISLPPGSGKTTLAIFYLTWIGGKHADEPSLTGSHSNSFVRGVYDEVLRILDPQGEYLWHDVFPLVSVSNTNAKDCRIDIGKRKRFETLEFTSIGTGNAGLYRAARLLYCDDLISGIEVALSKERLDKLWETYTTDLRQRKIGDHCKELHIATRWSVHDIIGRLETEYGNSDRARFIVVPALKPVGGKSTDTITKEKLRAMTPQERYDFSVQHPEEYKNLYGGNE